MDTLSKEQRRRNMQAIRSSATKSEALLAKSLWKRGYRYLKNVKTLPGKPDIVFPKKKIAVFCDGEFWHGKNWSEKKARIDQNKEYWIKKIERNIERDEEVNTALKEAGWIVIRFWDKEIQRNLEDCLKVVEKQFANIIREA